MLEKIELTVTMNSCLRYVGHVVLSVLNSFGINVSGMSCNCSDRRSHNESLFLSFTKLAANTRAQRFVNKGTLVGTTRRRRIEDAVEEGTSCSVEESASLGAPKAGRVRCFLDVREDILYLDMVIHVVRYKRSTLQVQKDPQPPSARPSRRPLQHSKMAAKDTEHGEK